MDWPVQIPAKLEAGRVTFHAPTLRRALEGKRDCPVTITIERKHATRSLNQNAYLWSTVYGVLSEYTGYTPDELHEWAKRRFLPKALTFTDGNGVVRDEDVVGGTTTSLNKIQFGEFIENIRRFAAEELDVVIPDPDPFWKDGETDAA